MFRWPKKIALLLVILFILPGSLFSQKKYLQITDFRIPEDSLSQQIGHHFWRVFCEQLTQNSALRLVVSETQIRELGNFDPEIHRIPDVIVPPDSNQKNADFLPIFGNLKISGNEYQLTLQLGDQARDSGQVALPQLYDWSQTRADLNQIISQVLRQLQPEFARQQEWFGKPLDPEKFHILITDFSAADSVPAIRFKNEIERLAAQDSGLQNSLEMRRIPASRAKINNETDALEIGKSLDVDVVVSGSLHASPDSLFRTTRVCLTKPAHRTRYLRTEVLETTQPVAADSPDRSLIEFLLAWAYLNHPQQKNDSLALEHLSQAFDLASPENQQNLLLLAANTADNADDDEKLQFYVRQFAPSDSFAVGYGHLFRAGIYRKNEQPDSAREHYLKAAEIFTKLQLDENLAQVYYSMGKMYLENDVLDSAAIAFQKAADFYTAADKEIEYAVACTYLGVIHQKNEAFAPAEAAFQKAVQIFWENNRRTSHATLYKSLAGLYYKQGQKTQALDYYKKVVEIGVEDGNRDDLASLCQYIGTISYNLGLLDQSLEFYEKYLAFTATAENPEYRGRTYNYLGFLFNKKGDSVQSRKNFEQAIEVFHANRDTSQWATTLASLGRSCLLWKDYQPAEKYLLESAALCKITGNLTQLAAVYKTLGGLHYQKGNPAQALGYYQKSSELWRETADGSELVTTLQGMASIYFQKGDSLQAVLFYRKAAQIQLAQGDSSGLAMNLNNIGRIFYLQSKWDSARVAFEQATQICTGAGLTDRLSALYQYLGMCWFYRGESARRLEFYEKATVAAQQEGDFSGQARIFKQIGLFYQNDEDYETALEYFQKAAEIYPADTGDLAWNIGYVYYKQEQWEPALDYLLLAKAGLADTGDLQKLMEVYFFLSKIYSRFGDSFAARDASYKYNAIYYLLNTRELLYIPYHQLAQLNLKQRKFEDAEAYARLALQEVELFREPIWGLLKKVALVRIFLAQKKYTEAISRLEKTFAPDADLSEWQLAYGKKLLIEAQLGASRESGQQFPELTEFLATAPSLEQARLFVKACDWKSATKHFRTARVDTLAAWKRAQVQTEIANCFLEQDQADSALSYLQPAQTFFELTDDSLKLAQVQAQIGAAYKIQKKWPQALASLRQSRQLHWQISDGPFPELGETLFQLADVFHQTARPDSASIYAWKSLEFCVRAEDAQPAFQVQALLERIKTVAEK